MQSVIKDPDLYQRFQNSVPNSLDAAVKWKGFAASDLEEELTFLITGDINVAFSRAFSSNLAASSSNVWIQCVHSMSD
jgi:meiotically up-regulated gene 157 (Mug157) protein